MVGGLLCTVNMTETHLFRSRDLIRWESSPLNPVLKASPEDKLIANPKLTADQRAKITRAVDLNNSDVDLCEFRGKTIITYSWGNQQGTEFLAEAVYDGSLASFLRGFFPQSNQGKSLPVPGEVLRVVGHTAFLILPKDKKETEAMPWVWYALTLPGLPGPEEKWMFQGVIAHHNPVDRVEPLAKAGVPVLHIHGDVDTVVPLETNSAELARRYRQFGGEMTLTVMKGQGHSMWSGWFQCQELVDFVIAHARGKGPDEP